jgi:hypothetical protein
MFVSRLDAWYRRIETESRPTFGRLLMECRKRESSALRSLRSNTEQLCFRGPSPNECRTRRDEPGSRSASAESALSHPKDRRPAELRLPRQPGRPYAVGAQPSVEWRVEFHWHRIHSSAGVIGATGWRLAAGCRERLSGPSFRVRDGEPQSRRSRDSRSNDPPPATISNRLSLRTSIAHRFHESVYLIVSGPNLRLDPRRVPALATLHLAHAECVFHGKHGVGKQVRKPCAQWKVCKETQCIRID